MRIVPRSVSVVVCSLLAAPSLAQTRPMTFEDVLAVKALSDPRVSPDGHAVALVIEERDLESNSSSRHLWRYDVAGQRYAQLTRSGKKNRSPRWSPEGSSLAFLSDRSGSDQVHLLSLAGGEAQALTKHATAVRAFEWSPDGKQVAFTAVDPVPPELQERREAGDDARVVEAEFEWPKLWLVEVATGSERQLLSDDINVEEFAWSPDGQQIAVRARPTTLYDLVRRTEIHLIPSAGGALTRLTHNDAAERGLVWAKAGEALFYTASDGSRFLNAEPKLFRLDLESRETQRLAAGQEHAIGDLRRSHDGRKLYFVSGIRTNRRLCAYDVEDDRVEVLTRQDGTVLGYDVSPAGATLGLVFSDDSHLPELWTGRLDPYRAKPAATVNSLADEWQLGETRIERWRSRDGWDVEGLLTLPVEYRAGRRYPLMVVLHGGPHSAVTSALRPGYTDYNQVLAGRGWAVLRPNYRGGSNYGDVFAQGMDGDTGGGDFRLSCSFRGSLRGRRRV